MMKLFLKSSGWHYAALVQNGRCLSGKGKHHLFEIRTAEDAVTLTPFFLHLDHSPLSR
ncbi:MAG: hypothetical protein RRY29_03055 [Desulfovibrionaceae bacterium]